MRTSRVSTLAAAASVALALGGCGPALTDAQRIWCAERDDPYNVLSLNSIAVLNRAEALDILPNELDFSIDNPNRPERYRVKPGAEPNSSGDYREEDIELDPEVYEEAQRTLHAWRGTAEYARACQAAYELDADG